jgi:hypothetical protein
VHIEIIRSQACRLVPRPGRHVENIGLEVRNFADYLAMASCINHEIIIVRISQAMNHAIPPPGFKTPGLLRSILMIVELKAIRQWKPLATSSRIAPLRLQIAGTVNGREFEIQMPVDVFTASIDRFEIL